jgi:hypothetical protein
MSKQRVEEGRRPSGIALTHHFNFKGGIKE